MSDPKAPAADEGLDQLPTDPQDRAEVEWLIAREKDPAAPPPNVALAQEHAELAEMLDTLPVGKPDRSWHDDVLRLIDEQEAAKAQAERPATSDAKSPATLGSVIPLPWWRRTAVRLSAAGTAVAAAAATTMMLMSSGSAALQLGITAIDKAAVRGSNNDVANLQLSVGITYRVAPVQEYDHEVELRIFRKVGGGSAIEMCGQPTQLCMANGKPAPGLEIKPSATGEFIVVAIKGKSALPEDASLEQFRAAPGGVLDEIVFTVN